MKLDDKALSVRIKNGDEKAYEHAFREYYGSLCLFAKKIVGDMDKSRDIVQDVFVKLYADRLSLQIETSLKSYLFKSVYNACLNNINQFKVHSRHHEYLKNRLPVSVDDDIVITAELEDKIRITVEGLPDQCKKIFKMSRYEGKKNKEIAETLAISIRTVETQISKALTTLRSNLTDFFALLVVAIVLC